MTANDEQPVPFRRVLQNHRFNFSSLLAGRAREPQQRQLLNGLRDGAGRACFHALDFSLEGALAASLHDQLLVLPAEIQDMCALTHGASTNGNIATHSAPIPHTSIHPSP